MLWVCGCVGFVFLLLGGGDFFLACPDCPLLAIPRDLGTPFNPPRFACTPCCPSFSSACCAWVGRAGGRGLRSRANLSRADPAERFCLFRLLVLCGLEIGRWWVPAAVTLDITLRFIGFPSPTKQVSIIIVRQLREWIGGGRPSWGNTVEAGAPKQVCAVGVFSADDFPPPSAPLPPPPPPRVSPPPPLPSYCALIHG